MKPAQDRERREGKVGAPGLKRTDQTQPKVPESCCGCCERRAGFLEPVLGSDSAAGTADREDEREREDQREEVEAKMYEGRHAERLQHPPPPGNSVPASNTHHT